MAQTVELADVLDSALETSLRGVWTAMPGRIETYSAATQSASVQLTVKSGYIAEGGDRQAEQIAVLPGVPVVHLGGGGYRTVYPIAPGDTALVVFLSRSISQWLFQGGIVDPGTDQHHSIGDAVALVGLRDFKHSLQSAPTDRMSIGRDSGASIEITPSEVRVGGNAGTEATLKGPTYRSAEDTLLTAFSTLLTAFNTYIVSIKGIADPTNAATPALQTGLVNMGAAITTFKGAGSTYLTTIAKVK